MSVPDDNRPGYARIARRAAWLHPLACPGMAFYFALFIAIVAAPLIFGA